MKFKLRSKTMPVNEQIALRALWELFHRKCLLVVDRDNELCTHE